MIGATVPEDVVIGEGVTFELGVVAAAVAVGGMSYFWICNKYASACGTEPQHTSRELVEARTS